MVGAWAATSSEKDATIAAGSMATCRDTTAAIASTSRLCREGGLWLDGFSTDEEAMAAADRYVDRYVESSLLRAAGGAPSYLSLAKDSVPQRA